MSNTSKDRKITSIMTVYMMDNFKEFDLKKYQEYVEYVESLDDEEFEVEHVNAEKRLLPF